MKKKILSIILVLSMLCAFMPVIANAADDMPIQMTTANITKSETDTTYNFDVAATEKYENCYVYAAIYAYDNTLLEVKRVPLNTTGNTSVSVSKSPYNALVKVFIWSDNMQPVIEAEEFTLTPTATMTPKPTAKPTPKPTATPTPKPTATPTPKPTATPTPTPKPPSNVTWSLNEATGTLTISGTGDMKDYDYDYDYAPWYNRRDEIKAVIIENGVTSIGNYAFYYCTGLTSVTIPDSVTSIGNYAFYYCTGLTSVTIPDSVTSIGDYAFRYCSNLTDVYYNGTFADFAKISIGFDNTQFTNAKLHCSDMTLDDWGKCGDSTAYYLDEATGTLTISGTGDMTDDYSAPSNNRRDEIKAVIIENGVTSIGNYAFSGCSGLKDVYIPGNVTSIGNKAFRGCSGLTSVTIPDNVTSIGESAFEDCSSLTSVTLGKGLQYVDENAFEDCDNLDSVYISDFIAYLNISFQEERVTAYSDYYKSNPMRYANKLYLNGKRVVGNVIIPEGATKICNYAFGGCDSITGITIPDSVTRIGYEAFYNCSGLKDVYITDLAAWCNIEFGNYYSNPMYNADNLYLNNELVTDLTIPDSVTSIGDYAFRGCSGLTSVTIPDSVTSIGYAAFYGCSGLKDVYITDLAAWCNIEFDNYYSNPIDYADNLYLNNELITDLIIPDGVTSIGDYAFEGCSGLTSVTIPDSVTSIGNKAFSGCSGLTSVTIPDSVTSIGNEAFRSCSSLASVAIGNSVKNIGNYAFEYCRNITTLNYNASVVFNAFSSCSNLTLVVLGDNVTNIDTNAFAGCTKLETIIIPKSVTEIESGAFENCSALTTVKYCGSEAEWNEMYIGSNNDYLKNANIVFDYVVE